MQSAVGSKQTLCIEAVYNVELNVYIISRETLCEIMYLKIQIYNLPYYISRAIALMAERESEESLSRISSGQKWHSGSFCLEVISVSSS